MSLNRSDSCLDIADEKQELLDLLFFYLDNKHRDKGRNDDSGDSGEGSQEEQEQSPGIKSIIKWKQFDNPSWMEGLGWPWAAPKEQREPQKPKKTVVFRDPLCEVRLYDKQAAKRQQWGHAKKFCRVKRFCWDKEDRNGSRDDLWLLDEKDEDYKKVLHRDMTLRQTNRKRRQTGESLDFMIQRLEISPNCYEIVQSKMRRVKYE